MLKAKNQTIITLAPYMNHVCNSRHLIYAHMKCSHIFFPPLFAGEIWGNGLVVKALDSQSRGRVFKITWWLQGRLSLSSF